MIETPTFQKQAEKLWCEEDRLAFVSWIAEHPEAGDVTPGADGARKCVGSGPAKANQVARE